MSILIGCAVLWNIARDEKIVKTVLENPTTPTPQIVSQTKEKQYVFVPYWTFTRNITIDGGSSLIYFGIGVDENGIDEADLGYAKIDDFVRFTPNANEQILAVRMTDKNINAKILKNPQVQKKLVDRTIELAKEYEFDGVLLDYETSAFAFDSITNNITSFFTLFGNEVKSSDLLFYVTLYGDTYFQSRPFDVEKIGELSDKVIIMSYDFSKSRGNPGPNFPLVDSNQYGYSFEKMISDFQRDVDNQKLVVALGYFGYDWRVNDMGESVTNGVPLSTNEIEQDFVERCEFESCSLIRVKETLEPSIKYTDKEGDNHIIWFEDEVSAGKKKEFLKSKGILENASWAYTYY